MDKNTRDVMFSSGKDDHETPDDLFLELHKEFDFQLDVCATKENTKLLTFISPAENGLTSIWSERNWCNPPYSKPERACVSSCTKKTCIKRGYHLAEDKPGCIDWVAKAYHERKLGKLTVMLLPVRTDTKYFHLYIWDKENHRPKPGIEIRLIEGRLKFKGSKDMAPFPSMVVVFKPQ